MKRTTIFLPENLHERLRREAFQKKVSMAELIRARLEHPPSRKPRKLHGDPLLEVAGIGRDGRLTRNIDEDLYGA